ncbi:type II toxin-antitoxin system RelE/ParE family toxin [Proteiniclasticum sp. SCR006]|uniref:Type II toxin-antitoxin system RelE/ParE family toxin n=1 Tax=Proteiniclasticum aestuarii TaxID=2817862 RepID=A0A939H7B2_9CLOT|nr:type II toxin-antitoxin system RelE/ParE family toxin [Proteiniclasticum aestuarii]MBO1265524.1 type II toxin-antitoxin system RelE/ParE family toxin [Proteiniclasticum aestuarii]
MGYEVIYSKEAVKSLRKLDKGQIKLIYSWIENNLVNTTNPRTNGKPLKGNLKEYWRYRVGEYRIIADIQDANITIVIVNIGHRRQVYK